MSRIHVKENSKRIWIMHTLLHFDPNLTEKSDGAWISLFKLTKNHKGTFFFVNVATRVGEATTILITVG